MILYVKIMDNVIRECERRYTRYKHVFYHVYKKIINNNFTYNIRYLMKNNFSVITFFMSQ